MSKTIERYETASGPVTNVSDHTETPTALPRINTPFGYFGSKKKLALQLVKKLPPHSCWVEAFCGSAALTLSKPKAPIEIINDIDGEIVNTFKQIRDNLPALGKAISLTPYAKDELDQARTKKTSDSDVERARKFLVQAMMSINGIFGSERGGFSYSHTYSRSGNDARSNRWYNLPERLEKTVERLRGVIIHNRDAVELVEMFADRPATLLYLDPPYLYDRTKGYTHDAYDEEFHSKLLKAVIRSRSMIFISGYENELYNSILTKEKGWSKKSIATTTKDVHGREHVRKEVVWMNRAFTTASKTKTLPLRLTKAELKANKINPSRKS